MDYILFTQSSKTRKKWIGLFNFQVLALFITQAWFLIPLIHHSLVIFYMIKLETYYKDICNYWSLYSESRIFIIITLPELFTPGFCF